MILAISSIFPRGDGHGFHERGAVAPRLSHGAEHLGDRLEKTLVEAVIALGHFATTRRADGPRGRHYHETVDFTTELGSGSKFAVDVGRRYTVFAYVSDVIPLPPPWEGRRAPEDTVVKATVTTVEAAPRGETVPAAS